MLSGLIQLEGEIDPADSISTENLIIDKAYKDYVFYLVKMTSQENPNPYIIIEKISTGEETEVSLNILNKEVETENGSYIASNYTPIVIEGQISNFSTNIYGQGNVIHSLQIDLPIVFKKYANTLLYNINDISFYKVNDGIALCFLFGNIEDNKLSPVLISKAEDAAVIHNTAFSGTAAEELLEQDSYNFIIDNETYYVKKYKTNLVVETNVTYKTNILFLGYNYDNQLKDLQNEDTGIPSFGGAIQFMIENFGFLLEEGE